MRTLPIDEIASDVRRSFHDATRSVIVAPTGSGKSTRIPLWMEEEFRSRVVVVEPRRIACRSLAGFLARQRGERVGESIGYAVRFDSCFDRERTRVVFVTPGVALNWLAMGEMENAAVLIDEFHERSIDSDLLAAALLSDRFPIAHLSLTSATIAGEEVAEKLGAPLFHSRGRTFPVEISYEDAPAAPSERDLTERVAEAVMKVVGSEEETGSILVFLPSWKTIREAGDAVRARIGRQRPVFEVHGSMQLQEIEQALAKGESESPVFLATNVAETSLTIPRVRTVIDSGLVKQRIHRAGRSALVTIPTSLASMDQRAGRAGRVMKGQCVRLFSRRYRATPFTAPEIEREPLDAMLLSLSRLGLDGPAFDDLLWLTEPPDHALSEARAKLVGLELLDQDGHVTPRGRRAGELPVAPHLSPVLATATRSDLPLLCDIVALLEVGGSLFAGSSSEHAQEWRRELVQRSPCRLFDEVVALREGRPHPHGLRVDRLREARRISNQLRQLLGVERTCENERGIPRDTDQVARAIASVWRNCAFVERARVSAGERAKYRSVPWTNGEVEISVDTSEVQVRGSDPPRHHEAALILEHEWVSDRGVGVRGFARTVLPVSMRVFRDLGLGDEEVSEVTLSVRSGVPSVRAKVRRTIGKVTLDAAEHELEGSALRVAAAGFILEGRLLKGTAGEIRDRLHVARTIQGWPEDIEGRRDMQDIPEDQVWVCQQLEALGLEVCEDFALLSPEDILPDVTEMTGAPFWTVDTFRSDFPRVWEHLGALYEVDVRARSGKVTLRPRNKAARSSGEPSKAVLPAFRGFAVFYSKASRTVRLR